MAIPLATVKELLQQQRDDFNSVIATLMESFNNRFDNLKSEVAEIKISLEFSQKEIESKASLTAKLESCVSNIRNDLVLIQDQLDGALGKIDYHENQSRRNNIRFDGVPEKPRETWQDSESKIQDILKTNFGFPELLEIERAHRVGAFKPDAPRTIVVKFNKYKDRESVLRNAKVLKGTSMYANDDVSDRVVAKRKELMGQLKEARSEGKIAYFNLDKLVIKERLERGNESQKDALAGSVARPGTRASSSSKRSKK